MAAVAATSVESKQADYMIAILIEGGNAYLKFNPKNGSYYVGELHDKLKACLWTKNEGQAFLKMISKPNATLERIDHVPSRQATSDVNHFISIH